MATPGHSGVYALARTRSGVCLGALPPSARTRGAIARSAADIVRYFYSMEHGPKCAVPLSEKQHRQRVNDCQSFIPRRPAPVLPYR